MTKEPGIKKKKRLLKIAGLCVLGAAAFLLLDIAYEINSSRSQAYRESEQYVDIIAAVKSNKTDPNLLTSEDYEKVEDIMVRTYNFTSVKPFLKLKNLKKIHFMYAMDDFYRYIDFSPLAKLQKLRELQISPLWISAAVTPKKSKWYDGILSILHKIRRPAPKGSLFDLGRLRKLKNIETLTIQYNQTCNFEALTSIPNLRELKLRGGTVSDKELEELQKTLPKLKIQRY